MLQDLWTIPAIEAMPIGEDDRFDRKREETLSDSNALAKALSALANSGGGHLFIGLDDDGEFTGVKRTRKGRTTTREWLEQRIPTLLEPEFGKYRVHAVEYEERQTERLAAIVVDVGDSPQAPFQARPQKIYYHRSGGHSQPAPHFYLEALRNRKVKPQVACQITDVRLVRRFSVGQMEYLQLLLSFSVENVGDIAADNWLVRMLRDGERVTANKMLGSRTFSVPEARRTHGILLPGESSSAIDFFGLSVEKAMLVHHLDRPFRESLERHDWSICVVTNVGACESSALDLEPIRDLLTDEKIAAAENEFDRQATGHVGLGIHVEKLLLSPDGSVYSDLEIKIANKGNEHIFDGVFDLRICDSQSRSVQKCDIRFGSLPPGTVKTLTDSVPNGQIRSARTYRGMVFDNSWASN